MTASAPRPAENAKPSTDDASLRPGVDATRDAVDMSWPSRLQRTLDAARRSEFRSSAAASSDAAERRPARNRPCSRKASDATVSMQWKDPANDKMAELASVIQKGGSMGDFRLYFRTSFFVS